MVMRLKLFFIKYKVYVFSVVVFLLVLCSLTYVNMLKNKAEEYMKQYVHVYGAIDDFPSENSLGYRSLRHRLMLSALFDYEIDDSFRQVIFSDFVPVYEVVEVDPSMMVSAEGNTTPSYLRTNRFFEDYDKGSYLTTLLNKGDKIKSDVSVIYKPEKRVDITPLTDEELSVFKQDYKNYSDMNDYYKIYVSSAVYYYGFSVDGKFDNTVNPLEN